MPYEGNPRLAGRQARPGLATDGRRGPGDLCPPTRRRERAVVRAPCPDAPRRSRRVPARPRPVPRPADRDRGDRSADDAAAPAGGVPARGIVLPRRAWIALATLLVWANACGGGSGGASKRPQPSVAAIGTAPTATTPARPKH